MNHAAFGSEFLAGSETARGGIMTWSPVMGPPPPQYFRDVPAPYYWCPQYFDHVNSETNLL